MRERCCCCWPGFQRAVLGGQGCGLYLVVDVASGPACGSLRPSRSARDVASRPSRAAWARTPASGVLGERLRPKPAARISVTRHTSRPVIVVCGSPSAGHGLHARMTPHSRLCADPGRVRQRQEPSEPHLGSGNAHDAVGQCVQMRRCSTMQGRITSSVASDALASRQEGRVMSAHPPLVPDRAPDSRPDPAEHPAADQFFLPRRGGEQQDSTTIAGSVLACEPSRSISLSNGPH